MPSYDYYEILEVHPNASGPVIDAAYRAIAKSIHPDSGGATRLMQMVNEAYSVLRDPVERARYDATRGVTLSAKVPTVRDLSLPSVLRFPVGEAEWKRMGAPKDSLAGLQVDRYAGAVKSAPSLVSVRYLSQDLESVASDLMSFSRHVKVANQPAWSSKWTPSKPYVDTKRAISQAIDHGLQSTGSLLDEANWNVVLIPARDVANPIVRVWFDPSEARCSDFLPNNGLVALAAWLQYLGTVLDPQRMAHIASRLNQSGGLL